MSAGPKYQGLDDPYQLIKSCTYVCIDTQSNLMDSKCIVDDRACTMNDSKKNDGSVSNKGSVHFVPCMMQEMEICRLQYNRLSDNVYKGQMPRLIQATFYSTIKYFGLLRGLCSPDICLWLK
jgi:hypothetical protein